MSKFKYQLRGVLIWYAFGGSDEMMCNIAVSRRYRIWRACSATRTKLNSRRRLSVDWYIIITSVVTASGDWTKRWCTLMRSYSLRAKSTSEPHLRCQCLVAAQTGRKYVGKLGARTHKVLGLTTRPDANKINRVAGPRSVVVLSDNVRVVSSVRACVCAFRC